MSKKMKLHNMHIDCIKLVAQILSHLAADIATTNQEILPWVNFFYKEHGALVVLQKYHVVHHVKSLCL